MATRLYQNGLKVDGGCTKNFTMKIKMMFTITAEAIAVIVFLKIFDADGFIQII
jgi:hypothetical protein